MGFVFVQFLKPPAPVTNAVFYLLHTKLIMVEKQLQLQLPNQIHK